MTHLCQVIKMRWKIQDIKLIAPKLKINLKLICYKNTTFLVLVIFGCFAIIKIYLKCWTTFYSAVHVHNYDTFLSVFLFEKNKY